MSRWLQTVSASETTSLPSNLFSSFNISTFSSEQQPNYTHKWTGSLVLNVAEQWALFSLMSDPGAEPGAEPGALRDGQSTGTGLVVLWPRVPCTHFGFGLVPEQINYYVNTCQRLRQSWRICYYHPFFLNAALLPQKHECINGSNNRQIKSCCRDEAENPGSGSTFLLFRRSFGP